MALNLATAILDCLKSRPEQKLTARQIAQWIFDTYPDECQKKKRNSRAVYIKTDDDLVQQLVAEIGSRRPSLQKQCPELKITEGRPRKYYYSEQSDAAEVTAAESMVAVPMAGSSDSKLREHEMYPLLSLYLWEEFRVYSKRIDEKRSSNKRGSNGNR